MNKASLVHLVQFRNSQAISPENQAMCYGIVNVKAGGSGGPAPETIRRGREESKFSPLEVLSVISPWNPLSTPSFHQENSAIAEGLVPLRVPGLEFTGLGVLCFGCRPSWSPA